MTAAVREPGSFAQGAANKNTESRRFAAESLFVRQPCKAAGAVMTLGPLWGRQVCSDSDQLYWFHLVSDSFAVLQEEAVFKQTLPLSAHSVR